MSSEIFNCNTGTFICTALLALFAFFQWRAVEKQNNQNLFKMRLEYISKMTTIVTDIGRLFVEISSFLTNKEYLDNNSKTLISKQKEIVSMLPETDLLFNKDITKIVIEFINLINSISSEVIIVAYKGDITNDNKKNDILKLKEELSLKMQDEKIFTLLCDYTRVK